MNSDKNDLYNALGWLESYIVTLKRKARTVDQKNKVKQLELATDKGWAAYNRLAFPVLDAEPLKPKPPRANRKRAAGGRTGSSILPTGAKSLERVLYDALFNLYTFCIVDAAVEEKNPFMREAQRVTCYCKTIGIPNKE